MKQNNMRIWENVCTTDPKYTKYVNQRGGFTAIDAQYQMMTATKQFGPMGWGWGVKDETFNFIEGMVIYQAILFYHYGSDGDTTKQNEIPLHSSMQVKPDCVKSVATDALTKGLSKLGFNADVFLGMFDNQKYVDNLKKKYAEEPKNDDGSFNPPTQPKEQPKYNADFVDKMEKNEPLLNGQRDKAMKQMNGGSNGNGDLKDSVCNFKKYKGMQWSEVALINTVDDEGKAEIGTDYMKWIKTNVKDLDTNTLEILNQYVG